MYSTLLADTRFHDLLLAFDGDLAEARRVERCDRCGGVLHSARYPRKPRGRPKTLGARLGPEHDQRFSYCCAVDGCRTRETPASLRFLGRKVYIAAVVVLVSIFRHGVTASRMERLSEIVRVDRRTMARWRIWWRDAFTASPFWQIARAAFMPPVDPARLPATLLDRFAGDLREQLIAFLGFMQPITGGVGMRAR